MCKGNIFTDRKAFYLEKFCLMGHVGRFISEALPWRDYPIWRKYSFFHLLRHVADLDSGSMSAQYIAGLILDIESVLHIARRMIFRHIQCIEVVPFAFEKRPFRNRKSQFVKNRIRLANQRRDRMKMAAWHGLYYNLKPIPYNLPYSPVT